MVPTPQQQNFMVFLKSTQTTCLCTLYFHLVAQQHTTLTKFISKILQNYCGKTSSFVNHSTDFIQKIKHHSINTEEDTLVSFDISAFFTSLPVPVVLQDINYKISTGTNFTNVCKIPTEKFTKLLEFIISTCILC